MNTKNLPIFLNKINLLKTAGFDVEEVENKILLTALKYNNFTDEEFENILLTEGVINDINYYVERAPYKLKSELSKNVPKKQETPLYCKNCNILLCINEDVHYCNLCGINYEIPVFFVEIKTPKRKSTNANYCDEWINYLQGKSIVNINENILNELLKKTREKCSINKEFCKNMLHMLTCKDIRLWLSALKYSKYYKYVPLLHRRITRELGHEIIPPQFNIEEERIIRLDWEYLNGTFTEQYKKLKPVSKKKNNSTYYPIFILFIVRMRFAGDERTKRLESYIHFQSTETYKLRLQCWENTCKIMKYNGKNKY